MIGIVVINYRNEALTRDFILYECSKITVPHVIVIVDNGSSNPELLSATGEKVLSAGGNIGFARANNLGAEWLRENVAPEYILFTNNDIRLPETDRDVVAGLVSCLEKHPEVAAAGPEILGQDGRRQGPERRMTFAERYLLPYWGKLFMSRRALSERLCSDYAANAGEGYHYWVSGAFFMVRAADFHEAGMFDPATFLYAEEAILSERFASIGKKVWFDPSVSVFHDHGATTGQLYKYFAVRRLKFESDSYYFSTYRGTPRWQILLGSLTLRLKEFLRR